MGGESEKLRQVILSKTQMFSELSFLEKRCSNRINSLLNHKPKWLIHIFFNENWLPFFLSFSSNWLFVLTLFSFVIVIKFSILICSICSHKLIVLLKEFILTTQANLLEETNEQIVINKMLLCALIYWNFWLKIPMSRKIKTLRSVYFAPDDSFLRWVTCNLPFWCPQKISFEPLVPSSTQHHYHAAIHL